MPHVPARTRTLGIAELLANIFLFVRLSLNPEKLSYETGYLLNCALVCKAFTQPALDELWHRPPSALLDLLLRIPLVERSCYSFRDPSPKWEGDWGRIMTYTRRVRVAVDTSLNFYKFLKTAPRSLILFPRIISVDMNKPFLPQQLEMYRRSSATKLSCATLNIRDCFGDSYTRRDPKLFNFRSLRAFRNFFVKASTMRHLRLDSPNLWALQVDFFGETFTEIFKACAMIEELQIAPLPCFLTEIPRLKFLRRLVLDIDHNLVLYVNSQNPPLIELSVPQVVFHLRFSDYQFERMPSGVNISASQSLWIHHAGIRDFGMISQRWKNIIKGPGWATLHSVHVSVETMRVQMDTQFGPPFPRFDVLNVLLDLRNLEDLCIDIGCSICVNNEDCAKIVEAWPRLRTLKLSTFTHYENYRNFSCAYETYAVANLDGLSHLARCIYLEELCISANATRPHVCDTKPFSESSSPTPCPLTKLNVACSRISEEQVPPTVAFLKTAFPQIAEVRAIPDYDRSSLPGGPFDSFDDRPRLQLWNRVNVLLGPDPLLG